MNTLRLFKSFALIAFAIVGVFTLSDCKKDDDDDDTTSMPSASFTYTMEGLTVSFTNTSSEATSYSWDFGDGNTSAEANPVHLYAQAGTYEATLTSTNSAGSDTHTETIELTGSTEAAESPELNLPDAAGAFYAINTVTVQAVGGFETTIKLGTAVAWFSDGSGFVDVGKVSFENTSLEGELDMNANKTYSYLEDNIPTTGFSNQGVEWSIEGGNGFSSVNGLGNLNPFPSTKIIDEPNDAISGGNDYTLSHEGSINNADSSIFSIYGPEGTLSRTVGGSTTSVTFTAAEMGTLGEGSAIMQIASYKLANQTLNTKKFYMINETVVSKTVTIN